MNSSYKPKIKRFLQQKNIAILGFSRKGDQAANLIYNKLKDLDYHVFAVNPNSEKIKDVDCFPNINSIDQNIDAAVLCTPSNATEQAVRDCAARGIKHIWIHQGIGAGSYDPNAFQLAKENEMNVIPGACPMMFLKPDIFHRCLGWFKKLPE